MSRFVFQWLSLSSGFSGFPSPVEFDEGRRKFNWTFWEVIRPFDFSGLSITREITRRVVGFLYQQGV
jgi:hypothetical protein